MRPGAVWLVAALLAAPTAAPAQPGAAAAGTWTGAIEPADDAPVTLTITLQRSLDGTWTGSLTAPAWQAEAVPLGEVSVVVDWVRFSATGLPGAPEFVGRLSAGGSEISGGVFHDPPAAPPATDIYLIGLDTAGSTWRLGTPVNITDRDGYDNQPRFLPDASAILYSSIRDGQADVYRYQLDSRDTVQLTDTTESEYSPTPLPSGDGFSTVRVEDDGTQRLWSFDASGDQPMLLLRDVAPVGYHGWLDDHRLGLFVLGSPPTLEIVEVDRQASRPVAESIGRSIHPTPDGEAVSFVHKATETDWTLDRLELEGGARRTLIAARPGSEDFVWAPDGRILMGEGNRLFSARPQDSERGWQPLADLSVHGVTGITRLDVSADGRWLALVGERSATGPPAERLRSPFTLRRAPTTGDD